MAHYYAPSIIEMLLQLDSEDIGQLFTAYLQRLPTDGTRIREIVEEILWVLMVHATSEGPARQWACNTASVVYATQILALSKKDSDLHFGASSARAEQLNDFDLDRLATEFETGAPDLWRCLGHLLAADPAANSLRERRQHQRMEAKAAARKAAMTQFCSRNDRGGNDNAGDSNVDELSESEDEGDPMLSGRASKAMESAITIVSTLARERASNSMLMIACSAKWS